MQQPAETLPSSDGRRRALIHLRDDGLYSVSYEAFFEDYAPEINLRYEYRAPYMRGSLTDTLENARKLAREVIQPDESDDC